MRSVKTFVFAVALSTNLLAAPSGVYVEAGVGVGLKDKIKKKNADYFYDSALLGSLALGYQLDVYRVEIESRYKKDSVVSQGNISAKGDLTHNTQMLNVYYSGYNSSKLVTTVGLGVGVSFVSLDEQNLEDSAIFTYQGIFSVGYRNTQHITTSLKYNYVRYESSNNFDKNSDHLVTLNLRYLF